MDGKKGHGVITGRVEILPPPGSGDGDDWIAVCGDQFDQVDAQVVCRDLGYDNAKVLSPGSFGTYTILRTIWFCGAVNLLVFLLLHQ